MTLAAGAQGQDTASKQVPLVDVGVARVDISPDYPVRLSGYGNRREESEGVEQRIWAKALAIGNDLSPPAILLTVENCGVSAAIADEVAARLHKRMGLLRERFAVCSTHSHTAPCLSGVLPNMFGEPIPGPHQEHIERYTRELIDHLEKVALAALADRKPGRLSWGQGKAGFAANRRVLQNKQWTGFGVAPGGPIDHALPVLCVTDEQGKVRAVLVSYACHCTTLGGDFNKVCGDWAGYAQEAIERDHPGSVALVAIGCGADMNPEPRTGLDHAKRHGEEIAAEVGKLLQGPLKPLSPLISGRVRRFDLPFAELPSREEWTKRAAEKGASGYHAQRNLERLSRGEQLPTSLPYTVQTWTFGNDLAMVFLAGEVVVDYGLRLKKDLDSERLWVNAYANDVPCYIASRRVLGEGGYEVDGSMVYYDRPTHFAPQIEDLIVDNVHAMLGDSWRAKKSGVETKQPPAGAGVKVGAAAAEFEADDSMVIGGGIGPGKAGGQEGQLRAVAVVLDKPGQAKLAIVACDVLMLSRDLLDPVVEQIQQRTGIPPAHVLINATHTHHAPTTVTVHGYPRNDLFCRRVQEGIVNAVVDANAALSQEECRFEFGLGEETSVGQNSRLLLSDNSIFWIGPRDDAVRPTGPFDPQLPLLAFRGENDKLIAAIFNHSTHTIGTRQPGRRSPSFYGLAAQELEGELAGRFCFLEGASGSTHNLSVSGGEMIERMKKAILAALAGAEPRAVTRLAAVKRPLAYKVRRFDEAAEEAAVSEYCHRRAPSHADEIIRTFRKQRETLAPHQGEERSTWVQALLIGDVAIVGVPAEFFTVLGQRIKEQSPFPRTYVAELANDWIGYLPDRDAFALGGYQTWTGLHSLAEPGTGEAVVDTALDILRQLAKSSN